MVGAQLEIEHGRVAGIARRLEAATRAGGALGARAQVLRARALLRDIPAAPLEARTELEGAIATYTSIGGRRGLALAYLEMADAAAVDGRDPPAMWLARAQPLVMAAGSPDDQRRLRRAFRQFGRRGIDHAVSPDAAIAMDALRRDIEHLRDRIGAEREAELLPSSTAYQSGTSATDSALQGTRTSAEELVGILEQLTLDREHAQYLVVAGQALTTLSDAQELIDAVPRLATAAVMGKAAALIELDAEEKIQVLATSGDAKQLIAIPHADVLAAIADGTPRLTGEGTGPVRSGTSDARAPRRMAVVALRAGARSLALVVEGKGASMTQRDLQTLALYASLASSALARAASETALRATAARDAALLDAFRDGVIVLDRKHRVTSLSEVAARFLGVDRAAAIGRALAQLKGLATIEELLGAPDRLASGEVLAVPAGDVLVRGLPYADGVVLTLQELTTARALAQKLVGSPARFSFDDLVGRAPAFLECVSLAKRAAAVDTPILIGGESGTGKELLAQSIHNASPRAGAPFVGVNVAAIPRELIESELFGYEKGAFTGASPGGRVGKFELAERGTLLLDEIGDMPLDMQVTLLRVLQERTFQRVGGSRDIPLRARIIATTHRELDEAVKAGTFRLDLYYRLRVVQVTLPPLRERRGDIALLAEHCLKRFGDRNGRALTLSPEVKAAFESYPWPGNLRELANLVEGEASVLPPGATRLERIPAAMLGTRAAPSSSGAASMDGVLQTQETPVVATLEETERRACALALEHAEGNVTQAARLLGISKVTLYAKLKKYGIERAG